MSPWMYIQDSTHLPLTDLDLSVAPHPLLETYYVFIATDGDLFSISTPSCGRVYHHSTDALTSLLKLKLSECKPSITDICRALRCALPSGTDFWQKRLGFPKNVCTRFRVGLISKLDPIAC